MDTQKLIDDIISGNASDSNTAFNDIMNAKIQDALASKKIELANTVYNGIVDQAEEEIENEVQPTETEIDGSVEQADQEV